MSTNRNAPIVPTAFALVLTILILTLAWALS
jgi:hypothetical protein